MCNILKADTLLAFTLQKKDQISFKELTTFIDIIPKFSPDTYLDISGVSFDMALYHYPNLFIRHDKYFSRANGAKVYFESDYIKNEFLRELPRKTINKLEEALRRADEISQAA